jgi:predicted choloylglycine hydrolase
VGSRSTSLSFRTIDEPEPGPKWRALFDETREAYQAWFLREGESRRPSYLKCSKMLEEHMPELVPMWKRLVALAGGGDHIARLLSLYRPTPYLAGCSQAMLAGGPAEGEPLLVRNYDYHPSLCEGVLLKSAWHGTKVIAMSDCLWGVLDGMNEHGLALSLAFGGRTVVGDGFGVPLVLRYVLEFCWGTREAVSVLQRVPSHMAYNVSVIDRNGDFATVELAPDRPPVVSQDRVATNHQRGGMWTEHAAMSKTIERYRFLKERIDGVRQDGLIQAFLEPPLFNTDYEHAIGTLYTAAYAPAAGSMKVLWPNRRWERSFSDFEEAEIDVEYV